MTVKQIGFILILLSLTWTTYAQPPGCIFKSPQIIINFGSGNIPDVNAQSLASYRRVIDYCPQDGHYSFAPYTEGCFAGDWHNLGEDHTAGDVDGNMLLVNAGYEGGVFFNTPIAGLKENKVYEFCFWLLNLCRPSNQCPYPLLPNINVKLQTLDGKVVTSVLTGEVQRSEDPKWSAYRTYFNVPPSGSTLMLIMTDNNPGGCGNDFAVDDITFRECVIETSQTNSPPPNISRKPVVKKPPTKKVIDPPQPKVQVTEITKPKVDSTARVVNSIQRVTVPTPAILKTRENTLAKRIETEAGEIKIDLYDNGVVDGDSVTIYHNNALVKAHMLLSQKPISFTISINPSQPHHEVIMVADNLGSIPPNTSVMIVTTPTNRYEVNISSDEQRNAKVVFDLKK